MNILVEDIQADKERLAELNQSLTAITADLAAYYEQRQQFERQNQNLKENVHQCLKKYQEDKKDCLILPEQFLTSSAQNGFDCLRIKSKRREKNKLQARNWLI